MTLRMPVGMGRTVSIGSHRWSASKMTVVVTSTARTNGKLALLSLFQYYPCHCSIFRILVFRFQRKEYGAIEIVQTEKKGFGLRAGADLQK